MSKLVNPFPRHIPTLDVREHSYSWSHFTSFFEVDAVNRFEQFLSTFHIRACGESTYFSYYLVS